MAVSFPEVMVFGITAIIKDSQKKTTTFFPPPPPTSHDQSFCFFHVNVRSLFRESACDSVSMREGLLCGFVSLCSSVYVDDRCELYGHYELHTKQ